ncbi:hypothetical protein [Cupriavidus basilensis]
MQVTFAFSPDTKVRHRHQEMTGAVVGNFIDRRGQRQVLVEYTGADGAVRREYVDEDLLVSTQG